jgi:membrane associated rhomboid family serine protease
MLDPAMGRRIPVLILLVVISMVTVIDWQHDLREWMMRPFEVVTAWRSLMDGDHSGETLQSLFKTVSYAFLHANLSHLAGNAVFLWVFGVVVCELCGWRWLVGAFLLTSIGGAMGQIVLDSDSRIATLGASGGLLGLEGFYFGLAFQRPRPEVEVWPLARPVNSTELAAAGAIGVMLDLFGVLGPASGVAYGAHLGGFVSGILLSVPAERLTRFSER